MTRALSLEGLTPGRRLLEIRVRRQLSQIRLAVRAHVSTTTLYLAERDKRHPQSALQERIAKALRVDRREIWP